MARRSFVMSLVAIFAVAITLRGVWLRADPPVADPVGIVWHDEGAWTHNARNRALWGVWRVDNWNPVFVSPVFTGLEYAVFSTLGVGLWQARVVPVVSGVATLLFLVVGLHALGGRRAAVIGAALLATSYAFVMWNRAALMESTMAACMTGAWMAYILAGRRPAWGIGSGMLAVAAWFTKAASAFFVAALIIDAVHTLFVTEQLATPAASRQRLSRQAAWVTLGSFVVLLALVVAIFVMPHWGDYRFYNWEMSVTRKPEYSVHALMDRASWLPLVHSVFSRTWLVFLAATAGMAAIAARWRTAAAGERLLVLWVILGLAELVVHDSGNERRYVMFVPALTALAALTFTAKEPLLPAGLAQAGSATRAGAALFVLFFGYLLTGSLLRIVASAQIESGVLWPTVRISAAVGVALGCAVYWRWRRVATSLARRPLPARAIAACVAISLSANLLQYVEWARRRDDVNYRASLEVGRLLAPGTAVEGKLANGLSLESRIRPLFLGNGFGNIADDPRRPNTRYILTYELPRVGFESSDGSGLIQAILDKFPHRRVVATFAVDETPGVDRAALIDKHPDGVRLDARD